MKPWQADLAGSYIIVLMLAAVSDKLKPLQGVDLHLFPRSNLCGITIWELKHLPVCA